MRFKFNTKVFVPLLQSKLLSILSSSLLSTGMVERRENSTDAPRRSSLSIAHTPAKMVKSHVSLSPELTWALTQNNVFVRRSRSATRQKTFTSFSAEKNNLYALHKYKFSGT